MNSASAEETVAIVAALEQFVRASTPVNVSTRQDPDPWAHAAILEGVSRWDYDAVFPDPG